MEKASETSSQTSQLGGYVKNRRPDANAHTPLHKLRLKDLKLYLSANKVDVNVKGKHGLTALDLALEGEDEWEICKILIEAGAEVDTESLQSRAGLTDVLRTFVIANEAKALEYFLSRGVDANTNLVDQTLLQQATNKYKYHYSKATIEVLLKYGADVNVQNEDGNTPFYYLVKKSDFDTVKLLLSYKPDVNTKNVHGKSPLNEAVSSKKMEIMQLLLDHGSDPNTIIEDGKTLIFYLVSLYTDLGMYKCLLRNGADANAVDSERRIPLMLLTCHSRRRCGFNDTFLYLLKYSNANLITKRGKNIFDYFSKERRLEKSVVKEIAKMKALEITINPLILDTISEKFSRHFSKCLEELTSAKNTKLKNCWVTFFNLLVDDRTKLKNYAGNADLVEDFESSDCLNKFPIYGPIMEKNMKKGIRRRNLFDNSAEMLSGNWPIFGPTHLVIWDLLDCLTTKDLSKFCE